MRYLAKFSNEVGANENCGMPFPCHSSKCGMFYFKNKYLIRIIKKSIPQVGCSADIQSYFSIWKWIRIIHHINSHIINSVIAFLGVYRREMKCMFMEWIVLTDVRCTFFIIFQTLCLFCPFLPCLPFLAPEHCIYLGSPAATPIRFFFFWKFYFFVLFFKFTSRLVSI